MLLVTTGHLVLPPIEAGIEIGLTSLIASLLPQIGPLSLAAGAGFGIGTGTFLLAQGIAAVVTAGALLGANYLLSSRPGGNPPLDPGKMKETFEAADAPEVRLVGRGRAAGVKAFGNTNGVNRFRLVLHCKGTVDEFEQYFIGGREVIVEADGVVSSPPWPTGSGDSYCRIKSKVGSDAETSWPDLALYFPSLWTGEHRVQGIGQTLVKFVSPGLTDEKFLKLYQNGAPDVEVVLRGENTVYDPRYGFERWSENGILNAFHILRTYPELSDIRLYDVDLIAAEASRADVLQVRESGASTKRARGWGFWSSETGRGDTMQQVLDSVGAMIVPRGNGTLLGLQLMDDDPTAEVTISARHILELQWSPGPQAVERPNICQVKYYSPERNYDMTEVDLSGIAWARVQDEIDTYGEKPFPVQLPFCPDAGQAQRIARRKFALARADSGIVTTNMAGLAVWGCRFANIEFPDDLGTYVCLVGVPRVMDDQGRVEIPFVVWPELTPWDAAVDEAAAPEQIPDLAYESPISTPATPSAVTRIVHPDGSKLTRVGYMIPSDAGSVETVYRPYPDGLPSSWLSMTEYGDPGDFGFAETSVDLFGLECELRLRTFSGDNGSYWSNPTLHVVVGQDNSAPGEPDIQLSVDGPDTTVTVTAPASLSVSFMTFTGAGAPVGNVNVRPLEVVTWTTTGSSPFTAQAFSSSGAGGPIASA